MSHENIERFVRGGYDLRVSTYYRDQKIHAMVWLGTIESGHNFLGSTLDEALAGLDNYLAPLHTRTGSPGPTNGDPS